MENNLPLINHFRSASRINKIFKFFRKNTLSITIDKKSWKISNSILSKYFITSEISATIVIDEIKKRRITFTFLSINLLKIRSKYISYILKNNTKWTEIVRSGTSVEEEEDSVCGGSIRIDSRRVRSRSIHEARSCVRERNRVNVRVIFAASCQPENPCANKVPHWSSNRVRFYQWPFGKWRTRSVLRSEDLTRAPAFCALKYRLIAPGFWQRFCNISCVYPPRCFSTADVIGPPNISRISNSPLRCSFSSLSLSLFFLLSSSMADKRHSGPFQEFFDVRASLRFALMKFDSYPVSLEAVAI